MTGLLLGDHACAVLLRYPDIPAVFLPEILPCVGFPQRIPRHRYDVWGHIAYAVAAAPKTGVSVQPKSGCKTPAARGMPSTL